MLENDFQIMTFVVLVRMKFAYWKWCKTLSMNLRQLLEFHNGSEILKTYERNLILTDLVIFRQWKKLQKEKKVEIAKVKGEETHFLKSIQAKIVIALHIEFNGFYS